MPVRFRTEAEPETKKKIRFRPEGAGGYFVPTKGQYPIQQMMTWPGRTPPPTPEELETAGRPYAAAGERIRREATDIPVAHFINQLLLNYPRYMAEQQGYEYPEAETMGGKILARAGGIGGAAFSPIYRGIAGLTGAGKVIAPATRLGARVGRGALGGAVAGGAYAQPMEERPWRAGIGAVLGGVFGLGAGGVRRFQETRAIKKGLQQYQKQYGTEKLPPKELPRKIEIKRTEVRQNLKQRATEFDDLIKTEAEKGATTIKPKLRKFGNNLSENYGKGLDQIDDIIKTSGKSISQGEVGSELIADTLWNVSDDFAAVNRIRSLAEKQGYTVFETIDEAGNRVFRVFHSEPKAVIGLKELVNLKNSMKTKLLSPSARKGIGFTREDMSYHAFQDAWGEFISKKFPQEVGTKFLELQESYAPLAQAKWQAYKIFKPYDIGEIDITKGSKFFRDYASGKLDIGKQKLLEMVEKGTEFSPGVGDVSSKIKALGEADIQTEQQLTKFINDLFKQKDQVQDLLAREAQMQESGNRLFRTLRNLFWVGAAAETGRRMFKK